MRASRFVTTLALAVLFLSAMAGCTHVGQPRAAATGSAPKAAVDTVAVVGDSITAVASPDFAAGKIDPTSWVTSLTRAGFTLAGGWAVPGATTSDMKLGVSPVRSDALILLAGTNDLLLGRPIQQTQLNLITIARTVGATHVVIAAIPPLDAAPQSVVERNAAMHAFARRQQWTWIDATGPLKTGATYSPGRTTDGVHPDAVGEKLLGDEIARQLEVAFGAP